MHTDVQVPTAKDALEFLRRAGRWFWKPKQDKSTRPSRPKRKKLTLVWWERARLKRLGFRP